MSILVVGMSHRSAPIDVLERASLDTEAAVKLSHRALETDAVTEAAVISTCNRVEVYVDAERFHGAVEDVTRLLGEHAGLDREQLARTAYVHYDDSAVARLRFVRAAQAAGFTLVQIRGIVDLRDHGQAPCAHVAQLVDGKLAEVHRRMRELAALQEELEQLKERARRLDPAECADADICRILV